MSVVLEVSELAVRRDGLVVVEGVTFTASRGEAVALMGPSGAGKTTVLRAIAGLEADTFGSCATSRPDQVDVRADPFALNFPPTIGMVFQFHHLFDHLTALQNVMLAPLHVARVPADAAAQQAEALLAQLGVGHRMHARSRELSGGEAQRVAIARALAMRPALLLMDEPTASLDPARRDELAATVRRLTDDGATIVMATHDIAFASGCADRIVMLRDGRIVREGRPGEMLS